MTIMTSRTTLSTSRCQVSLAVMWHADGAAKHLHTSPNKEVDVS